MAGLFKSMAANKKSDDAAQVDERTREVAINRLRLQVSLINLQLPFSHIATIQQRPVYSPSSLTPEPRTDTQKFAAIWGQDRDPLGC
jgi:hypothetical protein